MHVYSDPRMLAHDPGPEHPEGPWRLAAVRGALAGVAGLTLQDHLRFATRDELLTVHTPAYVDHVLALRGRAGALDHETPLSEQSVDAALLAAAAGIDLATDLVLGRTRRGLALVRPPGHHASADHGCGYCVFNNVALAAQASLRLGLTQVAILDWDVHHGNGTEDIFAERDDVLVVSMHQSQLFPEGRGRAADRGVGAGLGYTLNVPMPPGSDGMAYLGAFDGEVAPAVRAFAPELVLISCGFDAHRLDAMSEVALTEEDFGALTARAVALAEASAGGRVGMFLEGGYAVEALGPSVQACLRSLAGEG